MSKKEQEFSLEDIMREFSDYQEPEETTENAEQESEVQPTAAAQQTLTDETVRLDALPETPEEEKPALKPMEDTIPWKAEEAEAIPEKMPELNSEEESEAEPENEEAEASEEPQEEPAEEPEEAGEADASDEDDDEDDDEGDDEDDEDDGEEEPEPEKPRREPIPFRPKNRLQALKHDLIAGPERRYYEISEIGVGKLQLAMLVCLLVVGGSVAAGLLFAAGQVPETRMKLMVFGQILAMLIGGLMASQLMIEGVSDLFKGRFTMNTLLTVTFLACCADGVFCLKELRVPVCASFTLEVFMALWAAYHRRTTEMGQMDTLRKAIRLDGLKDVEGFPDGRVGFVPAEGRVSDFMDNYQAMPTTEKVQNACALIAVLAGAGVAAVAAAMHSVSLAVQLFSTSLLVAVPASTFIAQTRPFAVLERRLHSVGAVLCGWQGVKRLCRKAAFPLEDSDIFPPNSVKMNGVKFYGDRDPEQTIAYAAALMEANGGNLAPIFCQLLESRNGAKYIAENVQFYGNGGIGGEICDEPVLMGSIDFLKEMGVEVPEGTMVKQAVYVSIDGDLAGLFAITYPKSRSVAMGMSALAGCRRMKTMVLSKDFMLTQPFMREKFGSFTKKMLFPGRAEREAIEQLKPEEETPAMAMMTQNTLLSRAYAITGAKALRTACRLGLIVHILGGILGLLIMAAVAVLGDASLLTPIHVLMYQLVWMIPGLLVTMWARA